MDNGLFDELAAIAPTKRGEPLSRHTTFGIGGPADIFVTVRGAEALRRAVVAVRGAGAPLFVLGAGSNILVGDGGIRGVVIDNQAAHVRGPEERDGALIVTAESGTPFATLARSMSKRGFGGIEWAAGIPGTLGGACVYNAGAYDGCLADVLCAVTVLGADDRERRLEAGELQLAYRSSGFTRGALPGVVVLATELALRRDDPAALSARIADFDRRRLDAQPRGRNSGSTFKNPLPRQAWELIDAVGLRGERIGDAQFSEKHCNFIANLGAARARDVAALMREAQRRVRERFGIELENEVAYVGEGF